MSIFFVDTNIIISYIKRESLPLIIFINDARYKFYYTETVKMELRTEQIPDIFIFVNSEISDMKKDLAYDDLTRDVGLTERQHSKFRNDIRIIFEAGKACYYPCVGTSGDFSEPYLLTNNCHLYKKFIADAINSVKLEHVINHHGFEHIIELKNPKDVVIGF